MIRELHQSFNALASALSTLQSELLRTQPPHWMPLSAAEQHISTGMQLLTSLITDLWYERADQDGRETRSRHGIVMVNAHLTEQIRQVNACKDAFRLAVQKTRAELDSVRWKEECARLGQPEGLRDAMHFSGLNRVHLRQCYRHLPLLEHRPDKIGFSWYVNGRSIRKLSVAEAEKMLLALGEHKPHIQLQLHKLQQLPAHTALAQIQTLAPVVRANMVFSQAPYPRKAMNVPLPLFIPDQGQGLPAFNEIDLTPPPGRTRQQRSDQKVDPEPFLPSLRIHLYRD